MGQWRSACLIQTGPGDSGPSRVKWGDGASQPTACEPQGALLWFLPQPGLCLVLPNQPGGPPFPGQSLGLFFIAELSTVIFSQFVEHPLCASHCTGTVLRLSLTIATDKKNRMMNALIGGKHKVYGIGVGVGDKEDFPKVLQTAHIRPFISIKSNEKLIKCWRTTQAGKSRAS